MEKDRIIGSSANPFQESMNDNIQKFIEILSQYSNGNCRY
jgi:hypothetical protein